MAWTTPGTAVAGDVLTAAFWNQQVRDNSAYLYDNGSFLIATSTLGSAGTTFTFSSIPTTFRSLVLIGSAQSSSGGTKNVCSIRFNGDSGNNYAHYRQTEEPAFGGGYNIGRTVTNSTNKIQTTSCASTGLSPFQTTIHGYAQTTVHKSTTSQGMDWGNFQATYDGNGWVSYPTVAGLWKSTSAITSITVTFDSNVIVGSFFSLFGM